MTPNRLWLLTFAIMAALTLLLFGPLRTTRSQQLTDFVYVDASNRGWEDGSPASPWNTIAEGVTAGQTGTTILIAEGIYPENLLLTKDIRFGRRLCAVHLTHQLDS